MYLEETRIATWVFGKPKSQRVDFGQPRLVHDIFEGNLMRDRQCKGKVSWTIANVPLRTSLLFVAVCLLARVIHCRVPRKTVQRSAEKRSVRRMWSERLIFFWATLCPLLTLSACGLRARALAHVVVIRSFLTSSVQRLRNSIFRCLCEGKDKASHLKCAMRKHLVFVYE